MNQIEGIRIPAGRDLADVPNYRPPGIEICRSDHQAPPLTVLGGNSFHCFLIHVFSHQFPERFRADGGSSRADFRERELLDDVLGGNGRVNFLELRVVVGPEKSERRCERSGTDAGHQAELWPVAFSGPAHQQPSAEGSVCATTGDGQIVVQSTDHGRIPGFQLGLGHTHPLCRVGRRLIPPHSDVGDAQHLGNRA